MTNAEKYPNTQGALEAWRMYGDRGGDKPFDLWLSLSADIAPEQTLLEAAEKLIIGFVNTWSGGWSSMECLENLRKAVKREKNKPIRNCDRYRTVSEASEGFWKFCCKNKCGECRFGESRFRNGFPRCLLAWLYEEAEKESSNEEV